MQLYIYILLIHIDAFIKIASIELYYYLYIKYSDNKYNLCVIVCMCIFRQNIRYNICQSAIRVSTTGKLGHLQAEEREVTVGALSILFSNVSRYV